MPIYKEDKAETVHRRIKQEEHKLLPKVLADWKNLSSVATLTTLCD